MLWGGGWVVFGCGALSSANQTVKKTRMAGPQWLAKSLSGQLSPNAHHPGAFRPQNPYSGQAPPLPTSYLSLEYRLFTQNPDPLKVFN